MFDSFVLMKFRTFSNETANERVNCNLLRTWKIRNRYFQNLFLQDEFDKRLEECDKIHKVRELRIEEEAKADKEDLIDKHEKEVRAIKKGALTKQSILELVLREKNAREP